MRLIAAGGAQMDFILNRREALLVGTGGILSPALARAADGGLVLAPVVSTTGGRVQGTVVDGAAAYLAIPYGAPPVGPLRFMPPKPAASWKGVRDATRWRAIAVQALNSNFEGMGTTSDAGPPPVTHMPRSRADIMRLPQSEDCLSLDIWGAAPSGNARKPVMVWLHGGGYSFGSGSASIYAGANLARQGDVVVVCVNHRLNVFGYLHLGDLGGTSFGSSGNVGIQDIVLALNWVRDNISNFGGDPDNVTIFGQSGGGGKTSCLLAMPSAKGLFHKAIVMSGSTLRMQEREDATRYARALMAELGLALNDVAGLQRVDSRKLFDASTAAARKLTSSGQRGGLSPVVDGVVLPRHPFDPAAPELSADIPMILGTVKDEAAMAFRQAPGIPNATDEEVMRAARAAAGAKAEDAITLYKTLRPSDANIYRIVDIQTQSGARKNAYVMAERKIQQGRAPVWVYVNTWQGPPARDQYRAHHSIDLGPIFGNSRAEVWYPYTPEAAAMDRILPATWAAFAHTGDPNNVTIPYWPPYNLQDRPTMLLNIHSLLVNDFEGEARAFWASIPQGPPQT
jgi:para-nitrobenzyl esterase